MTSNTFLVMGILCLAISSCNQGNGKKTPTDTPTGGLIHIAVDEAFLPAIQSNITAFQGSYTKAKVIAHYVSEKEAFELLLKDSVRFVVSGRDLSQEERAYFKSIVITPKTIKIATDALGVVLNLSNPDSLLTLAQLRRILTEKDFVWNKLGGKGIAQKPELIIDKVGTSNYAALLTMLKIKPEEIQLKVTATGGDREVINYVNQHPEAIGFMGAAGNMAVGELITLGSSYAAENESWDHDYCEFCDEIADALSQIELGDAVLPLKELLKSDTPKVRAFAASCIGQIGSGGIACEPELQLLLQDADVAVRIKTAFALAHLNLGPDTHTDALAAAALDTNQYVAIWSKEALRIIKSKQDGKE